MSEKLPTGAVVVYEFGEKRCLMVIVGHAPDSARDPDEHLYFATEYRGEFEYPAWPDLPLYSTEFLIYNLEVGWSVGNADRHLFRDTFKRVKVVKYRPHPR